MLKTAVVILALTMGLVSACGEEQASPSRSSGQTPTSAPVEVPDPACSDLWVAGQDLPDPYDGCYEEDGLVEPETRSCSSGQVIVTYADRYYAVPGNQVNDEGSLSESAAFDKVLSRCGG